MLYRELLVDPCARPRMTRRDRWRNPPRPGVAKYRAFCDVVRIMATGLTLPDAFSVIFYVAMPKSWSKTKRREMEGSPHQQTPDLDNLVKALCDALKKEDKTIYRIEAEKRWAYTGSIVIYAD